MAINDKRNRAQDNQLMQYDEYGNGGSGGGLTFGGLTFFCRS